MSKQVVYNRPDVVEFVSKKIYGEGKFPPDSPSIGIVENGEVIGGVVYSMFTGNGIMMNVASSNRRWLNKTFLRAAFAYPFKQLGCTRVSGLVRVDNKDAQRFDEHLGFVREGLIREGDDDGTDLIMYGMLRRECRWLNI